MVNDRCELYKTTSICIRGKRGKSSNGQNKKGLNTKIHLAVDANGMPVRVIVTEGTREDCNEAVHLIEGFDAEALLTDWWYDTDEIISYALDRKIEVVIPPKRNRKEQCNYDNYLYTKFAF